MQNVLQNDIFSILEMFFKQQIVLFCCITQFDCHDGFHYFAYRVEQSDEFIIFENRIIWFIDLAKKHRDELFEVFKTMLKTKTLIENSFDDEHDVWKSEFYDLIEYLVFFRNDARDDFDDCLIDFVFDNLEKIDVFRICCSRNVVEIRRDERKEEWVDQTLNSCFFDENHDVVWTTKKKRREFEWREAIFCLLRELSRFLSVLDRIEHRVSMSDSKSFSNNSLFDDSRFFSDLKCLIRVFLNDELVLKRSSDLIRLNSCQIACFVKFEDDASRCYELRRKCFHRLDDCVTDELDVDIYLSWIRRLRRRLIEEQIIENALEFFHV